VRHVIKHVALAAPSTSHEAQRGAAPWSHRTAINMPSLAQRRDENVMLPCPAALLLPLSPTPDNVRFKEVKHQQT